MNILYRLTGWRIFRPARAAWGESTAHWLPVDWDWYYRYGHRYDPEVGAAMQQRKPE